MFGILDKKYTFMILEVLVKIYMFKGHVIEHPCGSGFKKSLQNIFFRNLNVIKKLMFYPRGPCKILL